MARDPKQHPVRQQSCNGNGSAPCDRVRRSGRIALLTGVVSLALAGIAVQTTLGADDEWKVPSFKARTKNPVPATDPSFAAGKVFYAQECLACHGETGRGDGPGAKDLEKHPGDLTNPMLWTQTDGALFFKITVGRRPMPSFRERFSNEERWHIVNYVRTLTTTEANPKFRAPDANRSVISGVLSALANVHAALAAADTAKASAATGAVTAAVNRLSSMSPAKLPNDAQDKWTQIGASLGKHAPPLSSAADITALRQAFADLSTDLAATLLMFGHAESGPVFLFECRTALSRKHAVWLQADRTPRNPYLDTQKASACGKLITAVHSTPQ